MKVRSLLLVLLSLLGASSFVPVAHLHSAPQSTTASSDTSHEYVDVSGYLTDDADINAWYELAFNLKQNFDDICGDTFCEGEYSNIESLRYRCSVEKTSGAIGSCVWVFAASNEEINAGTGKIIVEAQTWRCRSPLLRGTSIHDFLSALAGPSPLYAALPGTSRSLYDGLTSCL